MSEIIRITAQELSGLRQAANQSDKRRKNSAQVFESMPENGKFTTITVMRWEVTKDGLSNRTDVTADAIKASKENKTLPTVSDSGNNFVYSTGLSTEKNQYVSENALHFQKLLPQIVEIKNGSNKGKKMLRNERLSDYTNIAPSQDLVLEGLQGKSFSTTKVADCAVYKQNVLQDFTKNAVLDINEPTDEQITEHYKKVTELKNGYIFTIS